MAAPKKSLQDQLWGEVKRTAKMSSKWNTKAFGVFLAGVALFIVGAAIPLHPLVWAGVAVMLVSGAWFMVIAL